MGISFSAVAKAWRECDIVGLYLDAPENAIVLCIDEKSQIQALDRARLMLRSSHPNNSSRPIPIAYC